MTTKVEKTDFDKVPDRYKKSLIELFPYKDDVDYVDISSSKKEKCSTCGWYENERCGMVKGIIDPNGWCNLWGTKKFCK